MSSHEAVNSMEMRFIFRVVLVNFLQLVVEIILQVLAPLLWLGLKVNLRKMFWLNRLSFLLYPKGSICSEPDLLFSLLREFLSET